MRPWRAGCGGTRTSGSEGGGGETSSRKADTALRRRPLHGADHRFLTCVADHATGAIVWAAPGRNAATLQAFFDALTDKQKASIRAVSIDMSAGYEKAIRAETQARVCFDPFHVIAVRHEALLVRAGCKTPTLGCRGSPVKLRTV
jgi:transposase